MWLSRNIIPVSILIFFVGTAMGVVCYDFATQIVQRHNKNIQTKEIDNVGKEVFVGGKRGIIIASHGPCVSIFFVENESLHEIPLKVCKFQDNQIEKETK